MGHRELNPPTADAQTTVIPDAAPRIEIQLLNGVPILRWASVLGQGYTVETTQALSADWAAVPDATGMTGTGETLEVMLTSAEGTRFYRLRLANVGVSP